MNPIKSWKNIAALDFGFVNIFHDEGGSIDFDIAVLGFRADGKVEIVDSSGKEYTSDYSAAKTIDKRWYGSGYALNEQGQLIDSSKRIPILADIVYFDDKSNIAVSKNGNLYVSGYNQSPMIPVNGAKVCVYDETGTFEDYLEGLE